LGDGGRDLPVRLLLHAHLLNLLLPCFVLLISLVLDGLQWSSLRSMDRQVARDPIQIRVVPLGQFSSFVVVCGIRPRSHILPLLQLFAKSSHRQSWKKPVESSRRTHRYSIHLSTVHTIPERKFTKPGSVVRGYPPPGSYDS
jgi:hypothetical protein